MDLKVSFSFKIYLLSRLLIKKWLHRYIIFICNDQIIYLIGHVNNQNEWDRNQEVGGTWTICAIICILDLLESHLQNSNISEMLRINASNSTARAESKETSHQTLVTCGPGPWTRTWTIGTYFHISDIDLNHSLLLLLKSHVLTLYNIIFSIIHWWLVWEAVCRCLKMAFSLTSPA